MVLTNAGAVFHGLDSQGIPRELVVRVGDLIREARESGEIGPLLAFVSLRAAADSARSLAALVEDLREARAAGANGSKRAEEVMAGVLRQLRDSGVEIPDALARAFGGE